MQFPILFWLLLSPAENGTEHVDMGVVPEPEGEIEKSETDEVESNDEEKEDEDTKLVGEQNEISGSEYLPLYDLNEIGR